MNTEEKVIILAKINQIKDMQIYLLKEEKKLKKEYKRLQQLEEERKELREPNDITGDLWKWVI